MDSLLVHRSPSVGGVTKKLLAVNPALGAEELIGIIRGSMEKQGDDAGEFSHAEVINEAHALELARATLGL